MCIRLSGLEINASFDDGNFQSEVDIEMRDKRVVSQVSRFMLQLYIPQKATEKHEINVLCFVVATYMTLAGGFIPLILRQNRIS